MAARGDPRRARQDGGGGCCARRGKTTPPRAQQWRCGATGGGCCGDHAWATLTRCSSGASASTAVAVLGNSRCGTSSFHAAVPSVVRLAGRLPVRRFHEFAVTALFQFTGFRGFLGSADRILPPPYCPPMEQGTYWCCSIKVRHKI